MRAYVTTSWDDGGEFDGKLAERLAAHGVLGTFYWTVDSARFPLPPSSDVADILDLGMEIGSHTMSHPDVTAIAANDLRWELTESKSRLEELTEQDVSSFCYPFGYFNRRSAAAVADAGYRLARTTVGFRDGLGQDPYQMPVTIQLYPHGRRVHVTHAVKERNVIGLGRWLSAYRAGADPVSLVETALTGLRRDGGVLHLWGHSWELEETGLWPTLDQILELVSGDDQIRYVTNGQLMSAGAGEPGGRGPSSTPCASRAGPMRPAEPRE